ncbi:MAG: winged helix-turn-helix transcriptional regulator [Candidatus Phaeomarinobacter sp.]
MTTSNYLKLNCPIAESLSHVGDQWTLLIMRDALMGISSFTGFEESLGISRRLLSRRLTEMVESGLLDKVAAKEGGARMSYVPTQKGRELAMVLLSLSEWGERWHPNARGPRYQNVHLPSGAEVAPRMAKVSTGRVVELGQCASLPGPGADKEQVQRLKDLTGSAEPSS